MSFVIAHEFRWKRFNLSRMGNVALVPSLGCCPCAAGCAWKVESNSGCRSFHSRSHTSNPSLALTLAMIAYPFNQNNFNVAGSNRRNWITSHLHLPELSCLTIHEMCLMCLGACDSLEFRLSGDGIDRIGSVSGTDCAKSPTIVSSVCLRLHGLRLRRVEHACTAEFTCWPGLTIKVDKTTAGDENVKHNS